MHDSEKINRIPNILLKQKQRYSRQKYFQFWTLIVRFLKLYF